MKLRIPKKAWTVIHLFTIGWIAWVAAGGVSAIIAASFAPSEKGKPAIPAGKVAPVSLAPATEGDYSFIFQKNIFNSAQRPEDIQDTGPAGAALGEGNGIRAPKTSLPLKLIGTVIDPEGKYRLAAIESKDNKEQKLYKIGESVSGASISAIFRNRVILSRAGKMESLEVEFGEGSLAGRTGAGARGTGGREVNQLSDTDYVVSKRYLESQLASMNQLLTEVRAVPNIAKDGSTDGFKIFAIKQNSLFEKIGLQNQDVIKRINGIELNSAEKGLELFQALKNETNFNLDLVRNSQKTSMRFSVQ